MKESLVAFVINVIEHDPIMLTLYTDKISRNCQSYSRRELLKIGIKASGSLLYL